jgi:hypothetical protein
MKRPFQLVGALLHKDFRLFWPFAMLNALLIVLMQFPPVVAQLGVPGVLLQIAILLASILLILVVLHEDAMVSLNHDWLTRPIPGLVLLLAKCAFVVLAIIVPTVLGAMAYDLCQGRSVGESVLTGLAAGAGGSALILNLLIMAFAAVTANLRQAIIVFLAGIALLIALVITTVHILDVQGLGFTGSDSVVGRTLQLMLGLVAVSVLLVQYALRHTRVARVIAAVAVVAAWAFMLPMAGPRIFAVQKFLLRDSAAAASIRIDLVKGCFPAHARAENGAAVPAAPSSFAPNGADQSSRVVPATIAFATQNIQEGIPAGDRLAGGPMQLTYRAAGEAVHTLYPEWPAPQTPSDGGLLTTSQNWLLPRSMYDRLAHKGGVQTEIHYFLSLLAPRASAQLLADGRRTFYPGLGYCSATFTTGNGIVSVDCFKPGLQPAQFVASLAGRPASAGSPSGLPDFTPAVLDFWGGRQHSMKLRAEGNGLPRVDVTAFAVVAHFDRRIVVPGILGGPVAVCPAP